MYDTPKRFQSASNYGSVEWQTQVLQVLYPAPR